jgi:hypothetical protein
MSRLPARPAIVCRVGGGARLLEAGNAYLVVGHLQGLTRSGLGCRPQARTVMELVRAFWSTEDYEMVRAFNHSPLNFDFNALLRKLSVATGSA